MLQCSECGATTEENCSVFDCHKFINYQKVYNGKMFRKPQSSTRKTFAHFLTEKIDENKRSTRR